MTAAPQAIEARPLWRSFPGSPIAVAEFALILVLVASVVGFAAVYARAAGQDAGKSAAVAQIGTIASAVGAYAVDNSGYAGMTPAALEQSYGLRLTSAMARTLTITGTSAGSYCVQVRGGDWYAAQRGPAAAIVTSHAPVC